MFFLDHTKMGTNNANWQMGYVCKKKYFKESTHHIPGLLHIIFNEKTFIKIVEDIFL